MRLTLISNNTTSRGYKALASMINAHDSKSKPNRAPTHPGALLREDVIPALGKSVAEVARELRISRQTLHAILAETAAVTPAMALRLGKFCGNGPNLWLNMQKACDLWHAERQLAEELKNIPTQRVA
jgi:addiction module HigA family antidote